ncbi:hypothetical protein [Actinophytocola sp.]|uniref:hypothetical protein n=1 Tax=Actinophytocola sp. TaxID=1872138 RepID=UPI002ED44932
MRALSATFWAIFLTFLAEISGSPSGLLAGPGPVVPEPPLLPPAPRPAAPLPAFDGVAPELGLPVVLEFPWLDGVFAPAGGVAFGSGWLVAGPVPVVGWDAGSGFGAEPLRRGCQPAGNDCSPIRTRVGFALFVGSVVPSGGAAAAAACATTAAPDAVTTNLVDSSLSEVDCCWTVCSASGAALSAASGRSVLAAGGVLLCGALLVPC